NVAATLVEEELEVIRLRELVVRLAAERILDPDAPVRVLGQGLVQLQVVVELDDEPLGWVEPGREPPVGLDVLQDRENLRLGRRGDDLCALRRLDRLPRPTDDGRDVAVLALLFRQEALLSELDRRLLPPSLRAPSPDG